MNVNFGHILILLIVLVSLYMFTYGFASRKCYFTGQIWGINIQPTPKQAAFMKKGKTFMIIGIIGLIVFGMPFFGAWFSVLFTLPILALLYLPIAMALIILGVVACKKHAERPELGSNAENALILGQLPYIQAVEAHINEAYGFIISFEGIAFISNTNYCYAVERYENYQLGDLTSSNDVTLLAMYFEQKYSDQFNYKADFERIPGEPGQRITFVGSGGLNYGYSSGTPDKSIFRSYIFTRK